MRAVAYLGPRRDKERPIAVSTQEAINGAARMSCLECDGTGVYLLPDDTPMRCVTCKGSGQEWVTV